MKTIRLLLVEDDPLLRQGIMEILRLQKDIKVVAASKNKENTVLKIHDLKPNVVLLDLGLRSKTSLQVVKLVKKEFPAAKVIIMDLSPAPADIKQFVKAGATGFILKDVTIDQFLQTIRAVAQGKKILPTLLPESLFAQIIAFALKGKKAAADKLSRNGARLAANRSINHSTNHSTNHSAKRSVQKRVGEARA